MAQYNLGKVSISPRGIYDSSTGYDRLDMVNYDNATYVSTIDNNTDQPSKDSSTWQLIVDYKGEGSGDYYLGKFVRSGDAEKAAAKLEIASNPEITTMVYDVDGLDNGRGIIQQEVMDARCQQLLLFKGNWFTRYISFTNVERTEILQVTAWWRTMATNLDYNPTTHRVRLTTYNREASCPNNNANTDGFEIPLATTTTDGLLSKADKAKIDNLVGGSEFVGQINTSVYVGYSAAQLNNISRKGQRNIYNGLSKTLVDVGNTFVIHARANDTDENYLLFCECIEPTNDYVNGITVYCYRFPSVIDSLDSDSSTNVLSANMGKVLAASIPQMDEENDWDATQNFNDAITIDGGQNGKLRIGYNSPNDVVALSFAESSGDEVGGIYLANDYLYLTNNDFNKQIFINEDDIDIHTENAQINLDENSVNVNGDSFTYNGDNVLTEGDINSLVPSYTDFQTVESKVNDLELFKFPNVTIFGQPTIQQGQISNFSVDNYLQFPFVVDFQNRPWSIEFEITTGDNIQAQHNIFDSDFGLAFGVREGAFLLAYSTDGQTWKKEMKCPLRGGMLLNKTYRVKIVSDTTKINVYATATDTYQAIGATAETEPLYPKTITIGKSIDNRYIWNGSINLNKATLTISDKVVWSGMDDAGLSTRMAVNMNNIDDEGKQVIKDIVKEDFISKPQTEGTNGQVLTSNGDGTQSWQDVQGGGLTDDFISMIMRDGVSYKALLTDGTLYVSKTTAPNINDVVIYYAIPDGKSTGYQTLSGKNTKLTSQYWNCQISTYQFARYEGEVIDLSHCKVPSAAGIDYFATSAKCKRIIMPQNYSVNSFDRGFTGCENLEYLDLGEFDASAHNKDIGAFITNCPKLTNIIGDRTIDYVIENNYATFIGLKKNISFYSIYDVHQPVLDRASLRAVINGLGDCSEDEVKYTFTIGSKMLQNLTEEDIAIATNKGWTIA